MAAHTIPHPKSTLTSLTPVSPNDLNTRMSVSSLPSTPMKATKSTPSKSTEAKGLDNDVWTLLFAAHPSLVPNLKAMAAIDEKGRTASQLEHQLRKHRHAAKELAEKKAGILEGLVKKDEGGKKRKTVSEEAGKAGAAKKGKENADGDDTEEGSPAKKTKVAKKGTARIVKKGVTGGTKPKTKPKAKKGKETEQAEDASGDEEGGDVEERDTGVGEEDGDVEEDDNGMVEMKFER